MFTRLSTSRVGFEADTVGTEAAAASFGPEVFEPVEPLSAADFSAAFAVISLPGEFA